MKNLTLLIIVLLSASCKTSQSPDEAIKAEKPVVVTVNYPLYYFAQRIGGNLIQLEYPIPDGVDPAYWIPDDEAISIYQSANIILANGAGYAKWMHNVSLPLSRVTNTSKAFKNDYIELKDVTTHSHGPEGDHEHTGYAFTTWLDFELSAGQARAIMEKLIEILPNEKELLEKNFDALNKDLLELNKKMTQLSSELGDEHLIGSHPVYQYLSNAYGLQIQSVHFEPNEMPADKQWKEFDHLLEDYPSGIMLWEDLPLTEVKEILNRKGIQICVFNPSGNKPDSGDFLKIMNQNISSLQNIIIQ